MVSNRFFERSEKLRILLGTEGAHFVSSPLISKVDTLEADYRSLIALALPVLAAQIENQKLDKSIFAHIRSAGHAFKSNIELFHRDITYHINEEAAEINVYIERSLHIGLTTLQFS